MDAIEIVIRKTRRSERFCESDRFIAYVKGRAAGVMADTATKALQKLLAEEPMTVFSIVSVETTESE
jgi:hypothetical protein